MNLQSERFLFIDCQTTGANPVIGSILEIAWCHASASDSEPGAISSCLVKQADGKELPFRVQMLTGISDEEMINAIYRHELYEALKKQLSQCGSEHAIVHYASFEKSFLLELFTKHGQESFPLDLLCTYKIAKRLYPNLPTKGIRGLGGFFGAANCQLKRSSHHVEMTWSIWQGLVSELARNGINTMDELQNWLQEPVKIKRTKYEYPLENKKRLTLPDTPGIYKMLNRKKEVLYVGKAASLKVRVNSYFRGQKGKDPRKLEMLTQTHDVAYVECGSALEAALLETDEIKKHNPPYNISLKRNHRHLAFYSRSLTSIDSVQSDQHPIGPFSGHFALEQLIRLFTWIQTGEADPLIFYDQVSEGLIGEGFELFCDINQVDVRSIQTLRDLMALAVKLFKRACRLEDSLSRDATTFKGELDEEPEDELEIDEMAELTVEEVADKFGRLFKRAAKSYLRGQILTRLLNCRIFFEEFAEIRKIQFKGGQIVRNESNHPGTPALAGITQAQPDLLGAPALAGIPMPQRDLPWTTLDVITYDRLSVLLAEVLRMRASGQNVIIEPDVPLKLMSHKIN